MKTLKKLLLTLACCLPLPLASNGCGERVVLVPPGNPVRLAESAKVRIWVPGETPSSWVRSNAPVEIPEGWTAWPPPPASRPAN